MVSASPFRTLMSSTAANQKTLIELEIQAPQSPNYLHGKQELFTNRILWGISVIFPAKSSSCHYHLFLVVCSMGCLLLTPLERTQRNKETSKRAEDLYA
jgi:hypothetical protein